MTVSSPTTPTSFALKRFCCAAVLTLLTLAATSGSAQTTQTTQPAAAPYRLSLFAYGSSDQYWVASVEQYREGTKPRFKTLVRGQSLPAGDWKDLGVVFGHAAALADLQGELAILLEDGAWKRLGEAGITTGPTVPGSGPVLAWGSAGAALYAVRAVEGGKDAIAPRASDTTQPATRPATQSLASPPAPASPVATAATKPATRPLTLVLLRYERGQWTGVADLPAAVTNAAVFSLASIGNKPLLAASSESGIVRTFAWDDGKWADVGDVRIDARSANLGLASAGHTTALWTIDADGAMSLFVKREGETWAPLKTFALPNVPTGAQRAFAAAGEEFRLVFFKDGKFWEQRYDPTGAARGSLTEMPVPLPNRPDPLIRILQSFVLLGMVVVMLITFYRRRSNGEKKEET